MTVTVTNTGPVAGAEVVQVYVRDVEASVARPVRELKGFAKVSLEPGESRQVTIDAGPAGVLVLVRAARAVGGRGRASSPIEVGHHSRDLPLTRSVTIDAPSIAAAADRRLDPARVDGRPGGPRADPGGRRRRPARPDPRRGARVA